MAAPAIGVRANFAPNPTAQIDWDHPLAAGLVFCHLPMSDTETARGLVSSTRPARGASGYGTGGFGATFSNAATAHLGFTTGPFTIVVACTLLTAAGYNGPFERYEYNSESNSKGFQIVHRPAADATPGWNFMSFANNATPNYYCGRGTAYAPGHYVVAGVSDGTTRSVWVNGFRDATTTNNPNPIASTVAMTQANGSITTIPCALQLAYDRALSPNAIAMLAADPFAMLRR